MENQKIIFSRPQEIMIKTGSKNTEVRWNIDIKCSKETDKISCYIPAFEIYFTSKNDEDVKKKGFILSKAFFDNFFTFTPNNKFNKLAIELFKLGYKTTPKVTENFIKNKPGSGTFIMNVKTREGNTIDLSIYEQQRSYEFETIT